MKAHSETREPHSGSDKERELPDKSADEPCQFAGETRESPCSVEEKQAHIHGQWMPPSLMHSFRVVSENSLPCFKQFSCAAVPFGTGFGTLRTLLARAGSVDEVPL